MSDIDWSSNRHLVNFNLLAIDRKIIAQNDCHNNQTRSTCKYSFTLKLDHVSPFPVSHCLPASNILAQQLINLLTGFGILWAHITRTSCYATISQCTHWLQCFVTNLNSYFGKFSADNDPFGCYGYVWNKANCVQPNLRLILLQSGRHNSVGALPSLGDLWMCPECAQSVPRVCSFAFASLWFWTTLVALWRWNEWIF